MLHAEHARFCLSQGAYTPTYTCCFIYLLYTRKCFYARCVGLEEVSSILNTISKTARALHRHAGAGGVCIPQPAFWSVARVCILSSLPAGSLQTSQSIAVYVYSSNQW